MGGGEAQGIPGGLISKRKCLEGGGGDRLDVVSRDHPTQSPEPLKP